MSSNCIIPFDDERVVYDINSPLLLEASAGSGKTTVLVERIAAIILYQVFYTQADAAEIMNSLVAITFTRKAAAEMRDRIRLKIRNCFHAEYVEHVLARIERYCGTPPKLSLNEGMSWIAANRETLIAALSGAYISTVHSFGLRLLRSHPVESEIDPQAGPEDESGMNSLSLIAQDALFRTLNRLIKKKDPYLVVVIESVGFYKTRQILLELLETVNKIGMQPFAELAEQYGYFRNEPEIATAFNKLLALRVAPLLDQLITYCKELSEFKTVDSLTKYIHFIESLDRSDPVKLYHLDISYKLPQIKEKDETTARINQLRIELIPETIEAIYLSLNQALFPYIRQVFEQFYRNYEELLRKRKMITFNEIEWKFREVMDHQAAFRNRVLNQFQYLLIDEYQDTSDIQKAIFDHFFDTDIVPFVVGDPKQSIFRFRNANVDIFRDTADQFTARYGPKSRAYLTNNYRSAPELVGAINRIVRQFFLTPENPTVRLIRQSQQAEQLSWLDAYGKVSPTLSLTDRETIIRLNEGILYQDQHPGKKDPDPQAGFFVIQGNTELRKVEDRARSHAHQTAYLIRDLIENQGYKPGEIMLLIRRKKEIPLINSVFETELSGIPYVNLDHPNILNSNEIGNIITYLQALDNPHSDYYFLALLKSPFFRYTDDALLTLRRQLSGNDDATDRKSFYSVLKDEPSAEMRRFNDIIPVKNRLPVPELVEKILSDTGYYAFLTSHSNSKEITTNVGIFLDKLRQIVNIEMFSITDLLYYLEVYGLNIGQPYTVGEKSNVVRFMTVHLSKGLESKVVIYFATSSGGSNERAVFRVSANHKQLGMKLNKADSNYIHIKEEEKLYEGEEEKRLAYVAFTRAKQRFYYIGAVPQDVGRNFDGWRNFFHSELEGVENLIIDPPSGDKLDPEWRYQSPSARNDTPDQRFDKLFNASLPDSEQYPEIMTVTQLLDAEYSEQSFVNKYMLRSFPVEEALNEIIADQSALFMMNDNRADYGTFIHKVLSIAGPDNYSDIIAASILHENEPIRAKEAEMNGMLKRFFDSELYRQYYRNAEVSREEWEFNYTFRYQNLPPILIKGAVDKYLRSDGKGILIDYKLKVPSGSMERYGKQLNYYAYFLSEMGHPVHESYLYDITDGIFHPVAQNLNDVPRWLERNVLKIIEMFTESNQQ